MTSSNIAFNPALTYKETNSKLIKERLVDILWLYFSIVDFVHEINKEEIEDKIL